MDHSKSWEIIAAVAQGKPLDEYTNEQITGASFQVAYDLYGPGFVLALPQTQGDPELGHKVEDALTKEKEKRGV